MDIQPAHRMTISAYSGSNRLVSTSRAIAWVARSRSMFRGLVRPLTRMYNGTSRPASAASSPSHTSYVMACARLAIGCQRGRARPGAEVVADTGHQAAHLIGNRSHVDGLFAEYGQAGVLSGSGNEQGLIVILGNDLLHRPAVEAPTSSGGDAIQRRRTR